MDFTPSRLFVTFRFIDCVDYGVFVCKRINIDEGSSWSDTGSSRVLIPTNVFYASVNGTAKIMFSLLGQVQQLPLVILIVKLERQASAPLLLWG